MTVSSTTSRVDYLGNGSTSAFSVPFYFLDNTHLLVLSTVVSTGVSTTLVLNTDYTVTGAGVSSGGTVTLTSALLSGYKLSILRNVPLTQLVDYQPNDPFPANTHEMALDKLTMEMQQLSEAQSRSLTLAQSTTGVSTQLPPAVANAIIGFNGAANALVTIDPAGLLTVAGSSGFSYQQFSGTGAQTAFTLTDNPGAIGNLEIFVSGVRQRPTIDYTASGTDLTFVAAPPAGTNNILARWGQTLGIGVPSDSSVSTAKIADANVTNAKLADGSVTTAKLGALAVTAAKIADANVTLAKLSATGTPSISTYLRGDNTWAAIQAGFSGATTNAVDSSAITLVYNSNQYQVAQINSYANSYVTLPDATTMLSIGSNPFVIENRSPIGANLEIRDSAGTSIGYIPIGQIGLIQLKNKSTSAGQWVVETANPQTLFKYDGNSITSVTNSPAATLNTYPYFGIVGLSSTSFVRWWMVSSYSGSTTTTWTMYTQVGTISGSTITLGSTQSFAAAAFTTAAGSQVYTYGISHTKVIRLSNTAFAVMCGMWCDHLDGATGYMYVGARTNVTVNTVSGTTVTFGTPSGLSMPTYSSGATSVAFTGTKAGAAIANNGVMCRISDTVFAVFYNDAVTDSYEYPYNLSGSMSCQIVSVSGTTMTAGTKVNLGTSTYTVPFSCAALSASSVFLCFAQGASAGSTTGRTKLNVVSVSGTTPTFNTSVTIEASDVACYGTGAIPRDGAVAPSSSQVVFNTGYFVGEATVSGTVPTYDGAPYTGQLFPLFLSTSTKAWAGGHGVGGKAYLNIATGGFVSSTNVVDVLQSNLSVTSAIPTSPLGAQPTTSFVGYKTGQGFSFGTSLILLGTTT